MGRAPRTTMSTSRESPSPSPPPQSSWATWDCSWPLRSLVYYFLRIFQIVCFRKKAYYYCCRLLLSQFSPPSTFEQVDNQSYHHYHSRYSLESICLQLPRNVDSSKRNLFKLMQKEIARNAESCMVSLIGIYSFEFV